MKKPNITTLIMVTAAVILVFYVFYKEFSK